MRAAFRLTRSTGDQNPCSFGSFTGGSLDAHLAVFFDSRTGAIDPTANAKNNLSLLNDCGGVEPPLSLSPRGRDASGLAARE